MVSEIDPAGGHLLTSTRAAAVGVQFKVKPVQSNWQNSSHCPVLEIRRSNRGVCSTRLYVVLHTQYLDLLCLVQTATAVAEALCFHVFNPILMNALSQECLEGISSNLAQTSTWTQE